MSQEQVKQFIEQATQSLQSSNFDQAIELLDQAIALDPRESDAFVYKGIALSQLNRPGEAVEAFRQAVMLSPYNAKAYFNLGVHAYAQGDKLLAEEMARETVRIDPKHGGARDMIAKIEAERQPAQASAPQAPYVGDPLSGPQPGLGSDPMPPGQQPMGAPTMSEQPAQPGPQAPYGAPQTPTPTGYYREGYDARSVSSIAFVRNMGKSWDTVGLSLSAASVLLFLISLGTSIPIYQKAFSDPQAFQQQNQNMFMAMQGGNMIVSIISMLVSVSLLTWMILDISDKRSNWLWMLPYFLCCCCCGLPGVVSGIYIWKGRPS